MSIQILLTKTKNSRKPKLNIAKNYLKLTNKLYITAETTKKSGIIILW